MHYGLTSHGSVVSVQKLKLMIHWPFSAACFRRQLADARNHDTLSQQMIGLPAEKNKRGFWFWEFWKWWCYSHCFNIRVIEKIQKKKQCKLNATPFLFTNKQVVVCSDWPITVQLFGWFSARNWTCSIQRRFLAPEKIWHQKSMTGWPVSGTSWLVPETGTWNWPVCHHYEYHLVINFDYKLMLALLFNMHVFVQCFIQSCSCKQTKNVYVLWILNIVVNCRTEILTEERKIELEKQNGFIFNTSRRTANFFSCDALVDFLKRNDLSHVVRAHQVQHVGFKASPVFMSSHLTCLCFIHPSWCLNFKFEYHGQKWQKHCIYSFLARCPN